MPEMLLDMFLTKDYARASATELRALQLTAKGRDFLRRELDIVPD